MPGFASPLDDTGREPEFLSAKEVCRRLRISRTTLWRLQREDESFPKALVISKRSVRFGWSAVQEWVRSQPRPGAAR